MLEKLLEFLLHAKAGAISGVLLIGAGGALVSATTQDGVTTITIQQASPSPSVSASPSPAPSPTPGPSVSPSPSPSPSAGPSPTPSSSPSSSASPRGRGPWERGDQKGSCDDEAHERNEARKTAHDAFVKFHKLLEDLRHEVKGKDPRAAYEMLKAADKLIHEIDKTAKEATHEATRCRDDDDDDEDEDRDKEEDDEDEDEDRDEDDEDEGSSGSNTSQRFDGDARAITEQAAKAMETVYELAKSRLQELNIAATATKKPEVKKPELKKTEVKKATPKPSPKPTEKPDSTD